MTRHSSDSGSNSGSNSVSTIDKVPTSTGTPPFYTLLQRRLHWLVLVLIVGQYMLQSPMREALAAIEQKQRLDVWHFLATTLHTWSGISIALIMLWRWWLRRQRPVPPNGGVMHERTGKWVQIHHTSLYVVVGVMALSGAMHYYLGWSSAARWHVYGKWALAALIAVHIAGALIHAKQGHSVLQRMMGFGSLR